MAYTKILLMHADGTNGSTAFINSGDDSTVAFSPKNTARISTANPKWGSGAAVFDASNSVLEVTQNTATQGIALDSGDFTVEAWIYPTSTAGTRAIVGRWQNHSYILSMTSGVLAVSWAPYSTASWLVTAAGPVVPVNQWSHVAMTRQGNLWCIWRDGLLVGSATSATNATPSTVVPTTIGAYYISPGAPTGVFAGYIDEVRILKGEAVYTGASYQVPTGPFDTEPVGADVWGAGMEVVSGIPPAPSEYSSLLMTEESVLLASPSDIRIGQATAEIVAHADYALLPTVTVRKIRNSVLVVEPRSVPSGQISIEAVASASITPPEPALYAVSESVILNDLSAGVSTTQASMEIVGSHSEAEEAEQALYQVDELVVLASPSDIRIGQATAEIVAHADYAALPTVTVRKIRSSVLVAQIRTTQVRRVSAEIVAVDPNFDPKPRFYGMSELVLLSTPGDRISRVLMEVVAESGIVPPTNKQQVVWFATS